jgi:hypothetical protein
VRLARQLVALGLFFADRQQPDPGTLGAGGNPRVGATHDGELQQVVRPALDVRPCIQQNRGTRPRRNRRRQRRTIDAGDHPERGVGRHHRGPGMPGAEQRRSVAARHQLGGDADRGQRLAPQRHGRRVGHADHIRRLDDVEAG